MATVEKWNSRINFIILLASRSNDDYSVNHILEPHFHEKKNIYIILKHFTRRQMLSFWANWFTTRSDKLKSCMHHSEDCLIKNAINEGILL